MLNNDYEVKQRYNAGDKTLIRDVLDAYSPLIEGTVNQYAQFNVPAPLVRTKAKTIISKSLKTYDPDKGPLSNHLKMNMQGIFREINKTNSFYIPDTRVPKIKLFLETEADLTERFGRPPTYSEMADNMHMDPADIEKLSNETRRKITKNIDMSSMDVFGKTYKESESDYLDYLFKNNLLDEKVKTVVDYSLGINGKPMLTNNEIASKLGVSEATVRNLKDRAIKVIKDYE